MAGGRPGGGYQHIQGIVLELFFQLPVAVHQEGQVNMGILLVELGQKVRENQPGADRGDAQGNMPPQVLGHLIQGIGQLVFQGQHFPGVGDHAVTCICQLEMGTPEEKLGMVFLFQPLDGRAQGLLGNKQLFGGLGHVPFFRRGQKIKQTPLVHGSSYPQSFICDN